MRKVIAIAALAGLLVLGDVFGAVADDLLARGQAAFRAGKYDQAIADLTTAADSFASSSQLARYETALVYLTLAYARTNRETDATEMITLLAASERVEPHFATLTLAPETSDFAALAERLAPGQLTIAAQEDTSAPLPAVTPKAAPVVEAQPQPQPQPCVCPAGVTQLELEQQLAAQRAADQKAADERVAALQRAAEERIAALRSAALQPANPQPQTSVVVQPRAAVVDAGAADSLRRAEELGDRGDVAGAAEMYERMLASPSASRETLVEIATGFYRIGVYDRARYAFDRIGELQRGEEDLRYYKAVSLFETGDYYDARKEIACALPYLEVTGDVAHYRDMIHEMAQAAGPRAVVLE